MHKQNLMPQLAQPINRMITGQLPLELAELSEEALQDGVEAFNASVLPSWTGDPGYCSYDGDDLE
jgi:bacteriocin leader peptide (microcyclamide/patellamide family)